MVTTGNKLLWFHRRNSWYGKDHIKAKHHGFLPWCFAVRAAYSVVIILPLFLHAFGCVFLFEIPSLYRIVLPLREAQGNRFANSTKGRSVLARELLGEFSSRSEPSGTIIRSAPNRVLLVLVVLCTKLTVLGVEIKQSDCYVRSCFVRK